MLNKIITVGITGGIGAGKSIVSDFIEQNGFPVIRSDLLAKDLIISDEKIRKKVIREFGSDIYTEGKLNNLKLAQIVFSSKKNLQKINSIVHPPTIKKINLLIRELGAQSKIVFVESALIYEAKIQDMFDYIILVNSKQETRIQRSVKRDKLNPQEILARMKNQLPDEKKLTKADFVIENNSTCEELVKKTTLVLKILSDLAKL